MLKELRNRDISTIPHGGAAGGVGAGLCAAMRSVELASGMAIISEKMKLEQLISQSDIVITGEGKYDYQTKFGKVVSKVKSLAPNALVLCGINESGSPDQVFDLVSRFGIDKSIQNTEECIDILIEEMMNSMHWSSPQEVNNCINNSG